MAGSCFLSSGNKMYRLSTYLMAKNGKEGGSITSLKTCVQERSTIVTARLDSEGLIWEPIPAPRICCQMTLTAWKIWQRQIPIPVQSWKYHPEKSPWSSLGLCESFQHRRVVVGCPFGTCQQKGQCLGDDVSIPKSKIWLHQGVDVSGTELKNPTRSSLTACRCMSSGVSDRKWWTACQIWGTANWPIVWGQSCNSMESMVRAVTWRSLPYLLRK